MSENVTAALPTESTSPVERGRAPLPAVVDAVALVSAYGRGDGRDREAVVAQLQDLIPDDRSVYIDGLDRSDANRTLGSEARNNDLSPPQDLPSNFGTTSATAAGANPTPGRSHDPPSQPAVPDLLTRLGYGGKRAREENDSSDDEGGRRKKPVTSLFQWRKADVANAFGPAPTPLAQEVLELVANHRRDLKTARIDLQSSPICPLLKSVHLDSLLQNEYISFSQPRAYQHGSTSEGRCLAQLGKHELSIEGIMAEEKVDDAGAWISVYGLYMKSVKTVFPMLSDGLQEYFKHITGLFTDLPNEFHHQVLAYDDGFRIKLAQTPALTIGDYAHVHFNGVVTRYLVAGLKNKSSTPSHAPVASTSTKRPGGSGRPHKKLEEACRKWNEGRCEQAERQASQLVPRYGLSRRSEGNHLPRPRYLRNFLWHGEESLVNPSADSSEISSPLPRPPRSFMEDPVAWATIRAYPELFKVWTPINLEYFESQLSSHPNPAFVESVLTGFREGFWPHAVSRPQVMEERRNHGTCDINMEVLRSMRDEELQEGRWSPPFENLLPGMTTSPLGLIPKKDSAKFRIITDQSYGESSLNSLIDKAKVRVRSMGTRQSIALEIRCVFSFSPPAYASVVAAITGPANRRPILRRLSFDDFLPRYSNSSSTSKTPCSVGTFGNSIRLEEAAPRLKPRDHWVSGRRSKTSTFIREGEESGVCTLSSRVCTLSQQTTAPHRLVENPRMVQLDPQRLPPCTLCPPILLPEDGWEVSQIREILFLNRAVKRDLEWAADYVETSDGVLWIENRDWSGNKADLLGYCDACPRGVGFWFPQLNIGFQGQFNVPFNVDIFLAESLAVLHALRFSIARGHRRIVLFTDSMNSVDLFSLHSPPLSLAKVFRNAVLLLAQHPEVDLRVLHVPGEENYIADALSRNREVVRCYLPNLIITPFEPPTEELRGEEE
ncbi:hypothetical protein BT69DRAFT_1352992 [Atractiella rhizophila]|nr:hypothetical protein BT69DRAFT_1352992 [Atractiella rhizophila]